MKKAGQYQIVIGNEAVKRYKEVLRQGGFPDQDGPSPAGESLMLPVMLISNLGLGASCIAVGLKSKNGNLKQLGLFSGVSGRFAGVTEFMWSQVLCIFTSILQ